MWFLGVCGFEGEPALKPGKSHFPSHVFSGHSFELVWRLHKRTQCDSGPRPAQVPWKKSMVLWGAQARPGTMEKIHGTLGGPCQPRYHGKDPWYFGWPRPAQVPWTKSIVLWGAHARPSTMEITLLRKTQTCFCFFCKLGEATWVYCIVLYCIVLYCIVLYCIVLYCIVLCCVVLCCVVLCCIHSEFIQNSLRTHAELIQNSCITHS